MLTRVLIPIVKLLMTGRANLVKILKQCQLVALQFAVKGKDFSFTCGPSLSEDDDELTESKIRAFFYEKALELKKLQTPLYEEFYNSLNLASSPSFVENKRDETPPNYLKLPPKRGSAVMVPLGPHFQQLMLLV